MKIKSFSWSLRTKKCFWQTIWKKTQFFWPNLASFTKPKSSWKTFLAIHKTMMSKKKAKHKRLTRTYCVLSLKEMTKLGLKNFTFQSMKLFRPFWLLFSQTLCKRMLEDWEISMVIDFTTLTITPSRWLSSISTMKKWLSWESKEEIFRLRAISVSRQNCSQNSNKCLKTQSLRKFSTRIRLLHSSKKIFAQRPN